MKKSALLTAVGSALLLSACASTGKIAPAYVNPTNYQTLSCDNLSGEVRRVSVLASQTQQEQSSLSATGLGIGITGGRHGIYPTISFGVGKANSTNNSNIGLALGEKDAIVQSARLKHCSFANSVKLSTEK